LSPTLHDAALAPGDALARAAERLHQADPVADRTRADAAPTVAGVVFSQTVVASVIR